MAIVKSKLLKELSDTYPNFLKKDLERFFDCFLDEIKNALNRGERVEIRGFGALKVQRKKPRLSRNPRTGQKIFTPEKKTIHFKMSKELFNKVNEKKK